VLPRRGKWVTSSNTNTTQISTTRLYRFLMAMISRALPSPPLADSLPPCSITWSIFLLRLRTCSTSYSSSGYRCLMGSLYRSVPPRSSTSSNVIINDCGRLIPMHLYQLFNDHRTSYLRSTVTDLRLSSYPSQSGLEKYDWEQSR
jgi:hypothetical protein